MKKKIVHLQVLPILSGVQRISLSIFKNLDREKFELFLICAEPTGDIEPALITETEALGIKVIILKDLKREIGFHDIRALFKLIKIFREYNFDIIHTHSSKTGFLGRIAGKLSGHRAVIHTVHGIAFHDAESFLNRILYLLLEIFAGFFNDKVVLVNKFYRKKFWFIPERKLMTIYNSIDFTELKQKQVRNDNRTRLISIGRLDKQKSPMDLLKVIKTISRERSDITIRFVGDGEYFADMKKYIEDNDLQNSVELMGWRNDIPALLSESDIFISSPIYEAFGLVFCEAGYTGLPVISTEVEGIPEVVIHNKTGILVPPRDEAAMREAILYLAENKDIARSMGIEAKKRIEENFNLTRFIKEYSELYEIY
ncbi:glycosyltransferase family 4 protein [Candidatus Cloacimonadota bacterium]